MDSFRAIINFLFAVDLLKGLVEFIINALSVCDWQVLGIEKYQNQTIED